jgi:Holliday junction resolvase-like predicted endonuclease
MVKMGSKHNSYAHDLARRLRGYDFVAMNVEYWNPRTNEYGEIDVLAKRGSRIEVYEVKCSDTDQHYHTALTQLTRAVRALECNGNEVKAYYYAGLEDRIKEVSRAE